MCIGCIPSNTCSYKKLLLIQKKIQKKISYSIVYVFTYNNFKKIRVYGSTANNAVSLARLILLNERFLVGERAKRVSLSLIM